MKILIATEKPFAPEAVKQMGEIIENAGHQLLLLEKYTDKNDLLNAVQAADAMIVRSDIVDKEVLDAAKNLKIVVRAGAGYDNVDTATATANGVCVMNTPGQNSNAVAEMVFGMLLYLTRSAFDGTIGSELKGKKLGLHAFGNIGKLTAKIANGFGIEVFAFSPSLARNPERGKEFGVTAVQTPEELYEKSDIVSLHMPKNDHTKESVNYNLLSKLPQNGIVINTARKEVIDEDGLLKVFEARTDFRYLSDIEPDCKAAIAEKYAGRYFFTPKKMGAQTSEANINAGLAAAKQIVDFLENGITTYQVNK